jgi:hypothetical protein
VSQGAHCTQALYACLNPDVFAKLQQSYAGTLEAGMLLPLAAPILCE